MERDKERGTKMTPVLGRWGGGEVIHVQRWDSSRNTGDSRAWEIGKKMVAAELDKPSEQKRNNNTSNKKT